MFEGRRLIQALTAGQARAGQGQGAGLALFTEPGQFCFAGRADRRFAI
ncbi:hypothetical protein ACQR3P_29945 [Rhodococcus sp. IEGM1300]